MESTNEERTVAGCGVDLSSVDGLSNYDYDINSSLREYP
jgi:hypothetical protein